MEFSDIIRQEGIFCMSMKPSEAPGYISMVARLFKEDGLGTPMILLVPYDGGLCMLAYPKGEETGAEQAGGITIYRN